MRLKAMGWACVLAAGAGCVGVENPVNPGALDRTSPESTAWYALEAYQAKDLDGMAKLSSARHRELYKELKELGEVHPKHEFMFNSKRWDSVNGWDGVVGAARYPDASTARVSFGETGDRICVVELILVDGKWCYEDVFFPTRSKYEADPLQKPQR